MSLSAIVTGSIIGVCIGIVYIIIQLFINRNNDNK